MVVYHYCSLQSFVGIINTRTLFLSDAMKMNDPDELRWAIRRVMEKYREDESFLSTTIRNWYQPESLPNLFEQRGARSDMHSVFICCFSEKSDQLSQWRAYADDGCGVALGFEPEMLKPHFRYPKFAADLDHNFKLEKIRYDANAETIRDAFDAAHEQIFVRFVNPEENDNGDFASCSPPEERQEAFLDALLPRLTPFKSSYYAEEAECRLVYHHPNEDTDEWSNAAVRLYREITEPEAEGTATAEERAAWPPENERTPLTLTPHYRLTGSGDLVEYVVLPFAPEALREIVIGPKCRLTDRDIRGFLSAVFGSDAAETITIRKSGGQYR